MSYRIAPRDHSPTHDVEVGYLNDLMIAVKLVFFNLEKPDTKLALTRMLSEWSTHRSQISQCNQWHGDLELFANHRNPHAREVVVIDRFIDKLLRGLSEGNLVKHITQVDLDDMYKALRPIRDCRTRSVWYR